MLVCLLYNLTQIDNMISVGLIYSAAVWYYCS